MAKQTFTTGQVLTAAQQNTLQANDYNQTVSVKTANYSLLAADKGTRIEFNTSGSVTCTVNSGQFDAGDTLVIQNRGAGAATVTAGTATVNTSASLVVKQYDSGVLYFVSDSSAIYFASDAADTPLTTKGDLFTFSTAADRLAVGNDGETLVADSSASTGLRYNPQNALANPFINGAQDVWQRGTSFTPTAATLTYTSDRFQVYRASANYTISRQTVSDSTNLPNIQFALRSQRNSSNAATDIIYLSQSVETANAIPFAGKVVTLSFYARAGANFSAASSLINVDLRTGTGTDQNVNAGYTGSATPISTTATLTTSWQRFAFTGTIASTVTEFAFYSYWTPVGTAGANDWVEITGLQLDFGTYTASSAPTFRRSGGTLAGELAACQRYYFRIKASGANYPFGMAQNYSTSTGGALVPYPVVMRIRPTALETTGSGNDYQVYTAGGTARGLASAPTFAGVVTTEQMAAVNYTTTITDLVAGNANQLVAQTSSAFLGWSAEL